MTQADTLDFVPEPKPERVVNPGDFSIAAIGLDHGHINGMCEKLEHAGAEVKWVYDPDREKMKAFQEKFPKARAASTKRDILADEEVQLVAAAPVTAERGELGLEVQEAGKHFFTAKAPFTTLEQLEKAKKKTAETGLKWAVNYSERVAVESAVFAGQIIEQGAVGRVVQVIGAGPHRLNAPSRPAWFFEKERYGGILCDIGSHQIEQFLTFAGAVDAKVEAAKTANYANKTYPELEDFGDASLIADNGAANYFRVDWLTPPGLRTWGDGRTIILGTKGYIELRKNINVAQEKEGGEHLFLVNQAGEQYYSLKGKVGFPFYHELILDCLKGTEHAMTQAHAFKAAELSLLAQQQAVQVE